MKATFLISLILLTTRFSGFCTIWTITNSGMTFTPASITIVLGDSVEFIIAGAHNAVEVSDTTWNANGTTPLPGGFQVPFGGGMLLPSQLLDGVHYYVCNPHAPDSMKGIITVLHHAGISENLLFENISVYPNPATDFLNITTSDNTKYTLSIFNSIGEKIYAADFIANCRLPIANWSKGLYLIEIKSEKYSLVKKFMIDN